MEWDAVQISGSSCCFCGVDWGLGRRCVSLLSELARECQLQLRIVNSGEGRRSLIGIVEPSEKVAVNKELLAQQGHQIGQTPVEGALHLQKFDHQHRDQRRPDLRLNSIFRSSHERLDFQ